MCQQLFSIKSQSWLSSTNLLFILILNSRINKTHSICSLHLASDNVYHFKLLSGLLQIELFITIFWEPLINIDFVFLGYFFSTTGYPVANTTSLITEKQNDRVTTNTRNECEKTCQFVSKNYILSQASQYIIAISNTGSFPG